MSSGCDTGLAIAEQWLLLTMDSDYICICFLEVKEFLFQNNLWMHPFIVEFDSRVNTMS